MNPRLHEAVGGFISGLSEHLDSQTFALCPGSLTKSRRSRGAAAFPTKVDGVELDIGTSEVLIVAAAGEMERRHARAPFVVAIAWSLDAVLAPGSPAKRHKR